MLQQDTVFEEMKSIWDNVLKMNNPVVKVVKEYEMCLEQEAENIEKLTDLMAKVDELADRAFSDQCTSANPRVPLVSEIKQILIDSYYGNLKV
jgi:alcohol dehydrogenase class IV